MSAAWPPPPDLDSLKELFATADVEGLIADHCPIDEYDPEAKHFYEETTGFTTQQFASDEILPLLERLWVKQFMLTDQQLAQRQPALEALAKQIARFFGPKAQPQTRERTS